MTEQAPDDLVALAVERRRRRSHYRALPSLLGEALALAWRAGRVDLATALGLQLLTAGLVGVQVLVGKQALSAILTADREGTSFGGAVTPLLLLAALTAAGTVAAAVLAQRLRLLSEHVTRAVWARILDVTAAVELEQFEASDFYDRLQRVQTNALSRPLSVAQGLVGMVGGTVGVAGLAVALLVIQPVLLPLLLVSGVPLWVLSRRSGGLEFDFQVAQTPAYRMRAYLREVMTGRPEAKEMRAFGLSGYVRARYDGLYETYLAALAVQVRRKLTLSLVGTGITAAIVGGTLALLLSLASSGRVTLAEAGAAAVAIPLLGTRLQQLFGGATGLLESGLFLDDLRRFLALAPAARARRGTATPASPFGVIEAEDLGFTYPGSAEPALHGVSFTLRRGEVVALVGENGSGKTTLAKLLAGLYAPTQGTLRWDGVDATTLDPEALREQVAVVFQDFVHYELTARENIGLGRPARLDDTEAVRTAAVRAGAAGFLDRLPDGLDTPLSKAFAGGRDLSLGQWQRMALARAFFRDAPLIILDEPTASLDARAEHELFERVRTLLAGRTVLLVSHRFSSVLSADRVLVLEDGRITQSGSHRQLMRRRGRYRDLFRLQAAPYLLERERELAAGARRGSAPRAGRGTTGAQ